MDLSSYRIRDTYVGRLPHGMDMLEQITDLAVKADIRTGIITVIGAVSHVSFGYYDQAAHHYMQKDKKGQFEILSCTGNISIKDEKPMVHAHIMLSDETGMAFGGHLMSPTLIFAAEIVMHRLEGLDLVRTPDEKTGLCLW